MELASFSTKSFGMNPLECSALMTTSSCASLPGKRVSVYPVFSWILWFIPGMVRWEVIGVPDRGVREGVLLPWPFSADNAGDAMFERL
jgi:hypothetical protein